MLPLLLAAQLIVHGSPPPPAWLRGREAFVAKQARALAHLKPRLPVVYNLDASFVAAARERNSIDVVDDCGEAQCGVATDELPGWWDLADVRAMVTPAGAPRKLRDAYAAAITGWYGDDVDAVAADEVRAGLFTKWSDIVDEDDELIFVPAAAALIRSIDPKHRMTFADVMRRLPSVAAGVLARRGKRAHVDRAPLPLHGATLSVVNRPERSTISDTSRAQIEHLRRVGYDAISLMPFAAQRGSDATELRRMAGSPGSETDLAMLLPAARAHAAGMRVMLKPHVWSWPGGDATRIDPGAAHWPEWFRSYTRVLTHDALLARAMHAEWLCIGTELTRSESRPEWRPLIARVRALYHGGITYAANFDAFERTPFWRELDAVGIDAYFPLSSNGNATDAELRAGAEAAVARMAAVARATGKPVILTEVGYASVAAPWIEPWNERPDAPPAPASQARAFAAMLEAASRQPGIGGFFIWKYESDPSARNGSGYHPQNQPAEEVIRRFLR